MREVAVRIHSLEPANIGPERANKYNKTVFTPQRSLLAYDRVHKALFVYANLRFLNNVDSDLHEHLLKFLVEANHEVSMEELESNETQQAIEIAELVPNVLTQAAAHDMHVRDAAATMYTDDIYAISGLDSEP